MKTNLQTLITGAAALFGAAASAGGLEGLTFPDTGHEVVNDLNGQTIRGRADASAVVLRADARMTLCNAGRDEGGVAGDIEVEAGAALTLDAVTVEGDIGADGDVAVQDGVVDGTIHSDGAVAVAGDAAVAKVDGAATVTLTGYDAVLVEKGADVALASGDGGTLINYDGGYRSDARIRRANGYWLFSSQEEYARLMSILDKKPDGEATFKVKFSR